MAGPNIVLSSVYVTIQLTVCQNTGDLVSLKSLLVLSTKNLVYISGTMLDSET